MVDPSESFYFELKKRYALNFEARSDIFINVFRIHAEFGKTVQMGIWNRSEVPIINQC